MLLWSWCLAAVMAGNPNKRPIDKKIEHLKRAGPEMVNMYFVEAKPDGNNPAHQKGTLKNQDRRKSVAGRLNNKLKSLADVFATAQQEGCILVEPRGSMERFVNGDFKMATKQILKNYLRLRQYIDTDKKSCSKLSNKVTRKVKRFEYNLREKYCVKVYEEDWCKQPYEYNLDKKVANKN